MTRSRSKTVESQRHSPARRHIASVIAVPLFAASLVLGTGSVASAAGVAPAVLVSTDATITVRVGADRVDDVSTSPLGGVALHLADGTADGPTVAGDDTWRDCISNAAGECTFTVPETGVGGVNRDRILWAVQTSTAPGFTANADLAVRIDGPSSIATPYVFRVGDSHTGWSVRGGGNYTSGTDFMRNLAASKYESSGGVWQNSRVNPARAQACGIDVALVVDLSGSLNGQLPALRDAAKGFVAALTGTPSQVGIYTFATLAPASPGTNVDKTSVADAAGAQALNDHIDQFAGTGGSTNWDAGLSQVPAGYDAVVVLTDGNPTAYGAGQGALGKTRFTEIEKGIFSANALKAADTSVIAFGVGDGLTGNPENLEAISGTTVGVDYFQTADYAEAGAELRALALADCAGTLSVVKEVVNASTTGEDITGATPTGGWNFTAATSSAGVGPATQTGTTENETGAVNFPLSFAQGSSTASVAVTETQQDGYTIVTQNGDRAVCTNVDTGEPVGVTNDASSPYGFSVDVPVTQPVSCIVYNRPSTPVVPIVPIVPVVPAVTPTVPVHTLAATGFDGTGSLLAAGLLLAAGAALMIVRRSRRVNVTV